MKYSFIIPVRNRANLLRFGLKSISSLNYEKKDFEVIIIDQMSNDHIEKVIEEFIGKINIRYIQVDYSQTNYHSQNGFYNPGQAQNIGASKAQGDFLILTSPEIIHHSENLKNLDKIDNLENQFIYGNVLEKDLKEVFWDSECDFSQIHKIMPNDLSEVLCDWKNKGILVSVYYIGVIFKELFRIMGGIDSNYMYGVAYEDEDFGNRVVAVRNITSNCNYKIFGIHLKHSREYLGSTNPFENKFLKRNKDYLDKKNEEGWDRNVMAHTLDLNNRYDIIPSVIKEIKEYRV